MFNKIKEWDKSLPRGTFSNSLVIRFHRYGTNGETYEPFSYITHDERLRVTVPKKFHTDFASVPRLFWVFFPPTGTYARAAVLHDYLYSAPLVEAVGEDTHIQLDRKQCDKIFLEAMTSNGTAFVTRYLIYWAVRCFGRYRFQKN